jgi:NADH-ubiquinone oxidoreductase chain 2
LCETIEGIQSLLIGVFIYVLMTINVFAIVLTLHQNCFKYIANLGVLTKTNPILAITLFITMFSCVGIPPLIRFCRNFFFFLVTLGCGVYLLALIGVVISVINCFYYIRFVTIMYFDTPKTWILYKPTNCEKSLLLTIILFIYLFFLYTPPPSF